MVKLWKTKKSGMLLNTFVALGWNKVSFFKGVSRESGLPFFFSIFLGEDLQFGWNLLEVEGLWLWITLTLPRNNWSNKVWWWLGCFLVLWHFFFIKPDTLRWWLWVSGFCFFWRWVCLRLLGWSGFIRLGWSLRKWLENLILNWFWVCCVFLCSRRLVWWLRYFSRIL